MALPWNRFKNPSKVPEEFTIRKSIAKSFTIFEMQLVGDELRQVNQAVGVILTLSSFSFHTFITHL